MNIIDPFSFYRQQHVQKYMDKSVHTIVDTFNKNPESDISEVIEYILKGVIYVSTDYISGSVFIPYLNYQGKI